MVKPYPEVQIDPPPYNERPGRIVCLHGFLLIPHFFVLAFVGMAAYFALIVAWFAVTFTRRYPPGIFNFVAGYQAWQNRVVAYHWGTTRGYPPFALEAAYPITSHFAYPENGIDRWRPFLQSVIIWPRSLFVGFVIALRALCRYYLAWWSVLIFGRYPRASYVSFVRTLLWSERNFAYKNFMVDRYPPTFAETSAP